MSQEIIDQRNFDYSEHDRTVEHFAIDPKAKRVWAMARRFCNLYGENAWNNDVGTRIWNKIGVDVDVVDELL